jgi:hypothetical protein
LGLASLGRKPDRSLTADQAVYQRVTLRGSQDYESDAVGLRQRHRPHQSGAPNHLISTSVRA